jgi:hypothetical protein|nr:MAG TPA: hypothetical protein [Caudoviricetes sp.]
MNIIQIPFEHKMFNEEFSGSLENFIYDEFALVYTLNAEMTLGFAVFFHSNDIGDISGTEIQLVRRGNEWIKGIAYQIEVDGSPYDGMTVYCSSEEKKYTEIGHDIAQLVLRTMIYIMNTPRDKIIKPKTSKEKKEEIGKTTRITNSNTDKIYLLDEIVDYVNENGLTIAKSGNRTITCPCWDVRGHYRHYKSGKVVFIKNYEKGKEKGKVKPKDKTYTI